MHESFKDYQFAQLSTNGYQTPNNDQAVRGKLKSSKGFLLERRKAATPQLYEADPPLSFGVTQISRAVVTQSRKNAQQQVLDYSHRCSTQILR